jgi:aspartyl-tRNA synthetase
MTEFHGLDLEMAINEHYHETLEVFSNLFFYIFDRLHENMKGELEVIRNFSPFEDIKYRIPGKDSALILEFNQAIEMLEEDLKQKNPGCITVEELAALKTYTKDSDPSTPVEKRLGALVKQKYGVDFYMLDKYPLAVRPFYTMPDPTNDQHPEQKKSNSYDFFIRGQEILSGAQRVHDAKMLEEHVVAKGIPVESLKFYIDAFKDGALPHAGGGIGLERVVMLFLGIPNIRWAALFSRDPKRLIP